MKGYYIMKIQLSISLLASDQPSALERCLDSLTPLLIQVPSELIIVHTGTDHRIHELVCRYTDSVIPFTWSNDFSAARNVGIKAAKGEWFLYIDDDEWFEDTSEICKFFQSGEYQRYGMACYRQRNYHNWSGTYFTDIQVMRMMRMVPGIHFQNPIHEEPTPLSQPCKYFNAFVHHYGYVRTTDHSKTSRNLMLLKRDMELRPDYIKNYIQLVQEYASEEDWRKAAKYCRQGLTLCKSKGDLSDSRLGWLQTELVELTYMSGSYHQAELEALAILNGDLPHELPAADIYAVLVLSAAKSWNSEKTLQYGLKFEELLKHIENTPQIWREQNYGSLSVDKIRDPKRLCRLRMACLEAALDIGNQKQAAFFFSRLPWDNAGMIEQLYPDFDRLDSRFHILFSELLKKSPSNSLYQVFCNAIHMKEDQKERTQLFIKCIAESESDFLRKKAVKEILSSGINILDIVCRLDLETWRQYMAETIKNLSDSEAQKAWEASNTLNEENLFYKLILKKELLGRSLLRGYYTGKKFIDTLSEYAETILSYYKIQYRDEIFHQDNLKIFPCSCRFAFLISEALQKLESMEYEKAICLLHSALLLDSEMTGVINELVCEIAEMVNTPVYSPDSEFQILAKQMKETLQKMLDNGQYTEAFSIASQLAPLIPDDLELLRLRQKILRDGTK